MRKHNFIALALAAGITASSMAGIVAPVLVYADGATDENKNTYNEGNGIIIDGEKFDAIHIGIIDTPDEVEVPTLKANTTEVDFGTFENTYTADSVYVVLSGKKVLTDASKSGRKLQADEFSFTLKDSKGTVIETVKNDAKGVITFKDIEFATPGEYTYTIVEEAGTDKHITYDKSIKTIKVTVTGENGVLSVTTSATSETPTE